MKGFKKSIAWILMFVLGGTVVAIVIIIAFIYLLFRPYKESETLQVATGK